MTRPSPFSVRGRRALMVMRDEREMSMLRRLEVLYTAVVVACDSAQLRVDVAAYVERLKVLIRWRGVVVAEVLQMMRGDGLSETNAYKLKRQTAMLRHTAIEQLSADIIA